MTARTMKNRSLGLAAVLVCSVALAGDRMGQAMADQAQAAYAQVVNGPANPVNVAGKMTGTVDIGSMPPVKQAGPWTVDVAKLPPVTVAGGEVNCAQSGDWTVKLDGASTCGCGPQEVTNVGDKPIYVRDVDHRARRPYSSDTGRSSSFGGAYNTNTEAPLTSVFVPPGQRFVAEHVLVTVAPRNAGAFAGNVASAYIQVRQGADDLPLQWLFLPLVNQGEVYPGRQLFAGSHAVKLVVPPGGTMSVVGVQRGGADQASYAVITGYFEDL